MIAHLFARSLVVAFGLLVLMNMSRSIASAAEKPKTASEAKFQRDLESLFGATVRTKHGDMSIRQRKDEKGRVRKQIVVGRDFSEIQLDQDGDGTVDLWTVTHGTKTVEASHPNRGRFLRLVVTDRFDRGLHQATYLLGLNGRFYSMVKSKFTGKDVRYRVESVGPSFQAVDDEMAPPATVDAAAVPETSLADERFAADEEAWTQRQIKIFGSDFTCEDSNSSIKQMAELQRDWWRVLKYDTEEKIDRLSDKLKKSPVFDLNCRSAAYSKDFDKMVEGVSTVLLSSSKGEPLSTDKTRGRYLRCLEQSGLGDVAAKIEESFMVGVTNPSKQAPIRCAWKPGKGGLAIPAITDPTTKRVSVHMCSAQAGTANNKYGSVNNYANVMFHEFIHVGIGDRFPDKDRQEDVAHAAQACCGDPMKDHFASCQKLDDLVQKEKRYVELETHIGRTDEGLLSFVGALENKFGPMNADQLNREFVLGLDDFKDTPYSSLMSDAEFSKCVANSGETACRAEWKSFLQKYADEFFAKRCKKVVTGDVRKECRVSDEFKNEIATTIASSMIDSARNHEGDPSIPKACAKKQNAAIESKPTSVWTSLARVLFGSEVDADEDEDCRGQIGTLPYTDHPTVGTEAGEVLPLPDVSAPVTNSPSPVTGSRATSVVPSSGDIASAGGTNQRLDNSVGSGTYRPSNPDRSPLPVTRVDSSRDAETVTEQRYRRATDVVGSVSKGLEKVRDSLLPKAVADDSSGGRKSGRVDAGEEFIAFRPKKADLSAIKLDNPFSAQRSIASIDDIGKPMKGISGAAKSIEPSVGVTVGTSVGKDSPKGKSSGGLKDGEKLQDEGKRNHSPTVSAPVSSLPIGSSAIGSNGKVGGLSGEDLLAGLFTRPYRQIESRLKRIAVVEALIANKISIQDAKGRVLGARQAVERYAFDGVEKPLRKVPAAPEPTE